ncbi:hypothetical protein [Paenibacillus polymyxa]
MWVRGLKYYSGLPILNMMLGRTLCECVDHDGAVVTWSYDWRAPLYPK